MYKILQYYGGSFNGYLTPGSFFVMFVRGTIKQSNSLSHIVFDYISTLSEPDIAAFFHTETEPKIQIIQLGTALIVGVIVMTITFMVYIRRRRNNYEISKHKALEDEGSRWSEVDEMSVKRSLSLSTISVNLKQSAEHMTNPSDEMNGTSSKLNAQEQKKEATPSQASQQQSHIDQESSSSRNNSKNSSVIRLGDDVKKEKSKSKDETSNTIDRSSPVVSMNNYYFNFKSCIGNLN